MKVLLLGLGRANLKVAEYLVNQKEEVYLYEENRELLSPKAQEIIKSGKIKDFIDITYDLAVASPGFPPNKWIIERLKIENVPVIDEIEWTFQNLNLPKEKIIAITGTNGKSTTAALVGNILNTAGLKYFLGGNIAPGRPFSHALFEERKEYYVLEVSSFQLTRIVNFCPHIAVLTNISRDHLNWHNDLSEYINAKKKIFMNQSSVDYGVLNIADSFTAEIRKDIPSRVIYFGPNARDGSWLNDSFHFQKEMVLKKEGLQLIGKHNESNIMAAICVAKILGIDNRSIEKGINSFRGLPHRLEEVGKKNGILYINNSMCTNEASAIASFNAVKGNKIVILGGKKKGDEGKDYLNLLLDEAKACVLLGENAPEIARYFDERNYNRYRIARDMPEAVSLAREFAQPGDVILLNPGFASFGLFRDFQERGEAFKDAVQR